MNNETIKNNFIAKLSHKIDWAMRDLEETYEQAKERAKQSSCAGSSVWIELDKKYGAL